MEEEKKELTFGMKLVGLDFNPSGDPRVTELKQLAARMADIVDEHNHQPPASFYVSNIMFSMAAQDIKHAVMASVALITNKH